jgi:two-component system OmpR family sensor kinase
MQHVFERFYGVDQSRVRASGGVGLGLSIVAAVISAHEGRFPITSEPGDGATFIALSS